MRTESREILAVGIFGRQSRLGDRIELLLRRGRTFSPRASSTGIAASTLALSALLLASSLTPRWIAFAQQQPGLAFEVASIKPNISGNSKISYSGPPDSAGFNATNINLRTLIAVAYHMMRFEVAGGSRWVDAERYDVAAKGAASNISADQSRLMLQSLLADRFHLVVHRVTKQAPVYALLPARGGLRISAAKEGGCVVFANNAQPPPAPPGHLPPVMCGGFLQSPNLLYAGKVSMAQLANAVSGIVGRPVIDRTGFSGTFDARLEFSTEGTAFDANDAANPDTSRPTIFTALRDQLGLKLESQKGPVEILVIDHAEKPSEN